MAAQVPQQRAPKAIQRLTNEVVAKIAAGEVIQRPANVIKEMLENCIDANATSIQILVKDGGLKSISITDDGDGIRKEDLAIICERWTTSKLTKYDDLEDIHTFGFRGEALASISQVAHVTITTMQRGAMHGWQAAYKDGAINFGQGSTNTEPKSIATTPGTQILVEDLFYNFPIRKASLKISEEYSRIYDVVLRFALHFPHVAFYLRKMNEKKADITTRKPSTTEYNIQALLGSGVGRDLIPLHLEVDETLSNGNDAATGGANGNSALTSTTFTATDSDTTTTIVRRPAWLKMERLKFKMTGFVAGPSSNVTSGAFVLFINHRPVTFRQLRRQLEGQYATTMAANKKQFWYVSLDIDPALVDVNMHPQKSEVGLANQAAVLAKIGAYFDVELDKISEQRGFKEQKSQDTVLPSPPLPKPVNSNFIPTTNNSATMIRTDATEGSIDRYLGPRKSIGSTPLASAFGESTEEPIGAHASSSTIVSMNRTHAAHVQASQMDQTSPVRSIASSASASGSSSMSLSELDSLFPIGSSTKKRTREDSIEANTHRTLVGRAEAKLPERQTRMLTTVRMLLQEVENNKAQSIADMLKQAVKVGCLSPRRFLLQASKALYAVDMCALSRELVYQECLQRFGELKVFELTEPAPISALVLLAKETSMLAPRPGEPSPLVTADAARDKLISHRAPLEDYFGIVINTNGDLLALPEIIPGYVPILNDLPFFLYNLAFKINWMDELETFRQIALELAALYAIPQTEDPEDLQTDAAGRPELVSATLSWSIEQILLPAMQQRFSPSKDLLNSKAISVLVTTDRLAKIFERC